MTLAAAAMRGWFVANEQDREMSEPNQQSPASLSTTEAARRLEVSLPTILQWIKRGALRAWKTPGGQNRIAMDSVETLLRKRRESLNGETGRAFTLLLVEDDADVVAMFRSRIPTWPVPVRLRVAANGFDGLLQAGLLRPDLVVADLMMPKMDGFQMIRCLGESPDLQQTRVVVVTSLEDDEIAAHGGLPGNIQVFHKPAPFQQLAELVRNLALNQAAPHPGQRLPA